MDDFKKFLSEQSDEKPYKLVILSHDDPLDPNETAPMIKKKADELGIEVFIAELMGCYMEEDGEDKLLYSYPVDEKGHAELPNSKEDVEYAKPFRINPKDTLIMMRGLNARNSCGSWWTMARTLESDGYSLVNSVLCNEICNDKWYNQIVFQQNNINTPSSVLVRHEEGAVFAADKLDVKYPMILKTSVGSQGVGVMFIESEKALHGVVQLLYREREYIDIILQEQIKTDYDVRVIIVGGEVMGAIKRPIIEGDFRSNVSQGSEPEVHELTEFEKSESLRAAKCVDGDIVGVDFIPAKNREKDEPFFIEVNSTPGLMGIESTFAKPKIDSKVYKGALKKEKGKFSITTEILKKYMRRNLWNKTSKPCGVFEMFHHKIFGDMVGTMDTGNGAPHSVIHSDSYEIKNKQITIKLNGKSMTTPLVGTREVETGAGKEERPIINLDIKFNNKFYYSYPFTIDDRNGKSTLLINRILLKDLNVMVNPNKSYIITKKMENR